MMRFSEYLKEQELWRTADNGKKFAFDDKTGEITKGYFAGAVLKGYKQPGSLKPDVIRGKVAKADKCKKMLDDINFKKVKRTLGYEETYLLGRQVSEAKSYYESAEIAEKQLKDVFKADPRIKIAFDKLNELRFDHSDKLIKNAEYELTQGKEGETVSIQDLYTAKKKQQEALNNFRDSIRAYEKKSGKRFDTPVFQYWNPKHDH